MSVCQKHLQESRVTMLACPECESENVECTVGFLGEHTHTCMDCHLVDGAPADA